MTIQQSAESNQIFLPSNPLSKYTFLYSKMEWGISSLGDFHMVWRIAFGVSVLYRVSGANKNIKLPSPRGSPPFPAFRKLSLRRSDGAIVRTRKRERRSFSFNLSSPRHDQYVFNLSTNLSIFIVPLSASRKKLITSPLSSSVKNASGTNEGFSPWTSFNISFRS